MRKAMYKKIKVFRTVLVLSALGWAVHGYAKTADTALHASGNKLPEFARVMQLQLGDRACYVALVDAYGKRHDALADFEFCARTQLLTKPVRIKYAKTPIMAEECQGRDDCSLSEQVDLIIEMHEIKAH